MQCDYYQNLILVKFRNLFLSYMHVVFALSSGSFPGVEQPGCGIDHPPPYSTEVKERVELYLYPTSGTLWSVIGWTLPLPLPCFVTDVQVGYLCLQITGLCQHSFLILTLMKTWILCQFLQWTDVPRKGYFSFTKLYWFCVPYVNNGLNDLTVQSDCWNWYYCICLFVLQILVSR